MNFKDNMFQTYQHYAKIFLIKTQFIVIFEVNFELFCYFME
jgi:hypothetical protein